MDISVNDLLSACESLIKIKGNYNTNENQLELANIRSQLLNHNLSDSSQFQQRQNIKQKLSQIADSIYEKMKPQLNQLNQKK